MANTVQTQYMAMVPLRLFDWNSFSEFSEETQLHILEKTCQYPLCQKYPASASYQQAFIKTLMSKAERSGHEVAGDLYVAYTEVLDRQVVAGDHGDDGDAAVRSTNMAYRIYCTREESECAHPIVLQEAGSFVSQGTTGLQTWAAAVCLAEWLLSHQAFFADKEVLELGCGIGLVGSALMFWCRAAPPSRVVLTDHHPSVLRQLTHNIALNTCDVKTGEPVSGGRESRLDTLQPAEAATMSETLRTPAQCQTSTRCSDTARSTEYPCSTHAHGSGCPCVRVAELNWCESSEEGTASRLLMSQISPDIILAADVVFDNTLIPSLVSTLQALLEPSRRPESAPPIALACCTIRNEDTFQCFLSALDGHRLVWQDLLLAQQQLWCDRSCTVRLLRITATSVPLTEWEMG